MNLPDPQPAPARILVVDDENSTRVVVARALQLSGYHVETAENGQKAIDCLSTSSFDVMLLDLNMPVLDGNQVMNVVREQYPHLQVIILTAHASLDSAITAVKTGAVDYLLKPQSISQIKQAVQAAMKRRFQQTQHENLLEILGLAVQTLQAEPGVIPRQMPAPEGIVPAIALPGFLFEPALRQVTSYNDDFVHDFSSSRTAQLSSHQSAILSCLLRRPNQAVSCQEICQTALGYHHLTQAEAEYIVRPHIFKLRQKIEKDPSNPQHIQSVRGKGYLFYISEAQSG